MYSEKQWPLSVPGHHDPQFEQHMEHIFRMIYALIPHRDEVDYQNFYMMIPILPRQDAWRRLWPSELPASIELQSDLNQLILIIMLTLRAIDERIKAGKATQRFKAISSLWHSYLWRTTDPELMLVRECIFSAFVFKYDWIC